MKMLSSGFFKIIWGIFMPNTKTYKESAGENPKRFPFTNRYAFNASVSAFNFFYGLFMLYMNLKIKFYVLFFVFKVWHLNEFSLN